MRDSEILDVLIRIEAILSDMRTLLVSLRQTDSRESQNSIKLSKETRDYLQTIQVGASHFQIQRLYMEHFEHDHTAQKCKVLLRWDRFSIFVDFVQSVAAIHEMPIPTRGEIETELFNRSIGLGPISDTFIGKYAMPLFDGVVNAGVNVPGWPDEKKT